MKFVRTGEYRQDALERQVEIDSLQETRARLKRLDYLLGFVRARNSEVYPEYVDNLLAKYQGLLEEDRRKVIPSDLDVMVPEYPNLTEHPELARVALNYTLQILKLPAEVNLGKAEVVNKNYFKLFSHPSYYNLLALTETLGRQDAISLYKKFVTHYWIDEQALDQVLRAFREVLNSI